jgi:hypothetical protein
LVINREKIGVIIDLVWVIQLGIVVIMLFGVINEDIVHDEGVVIGLSCINGVILSV